MKIEIEITEQEIKDIKAVRNYFGEHDKTCFEHMAYAVLDRLVKKLNIPCVIKSVCECEEPKFSQYIDFCLNCGLPPKED